MFNERPVRIEKTTVKSKGGGSNGIKIRKIFDAKRKELTHELCQVNIL